MYSICTVLGKESEFEVRVVYCQVLKFKFAFDVAKTLNPYVDRPWDTIYLLYLLSNNLKRGSISGVSKKRFIGVRCVQKACAHCLTCTD